MLTSDSLKLGELPIQRVTPHAAEKLGGDVHAGMVLPMTSSRKVLAAVLWGRTFEFTCVRKRAKPASAGGCNDWLGLSCQDALPRSDGEHCLRIDAGDGQQRSRSAAWLLTPLLPALESANRHA